MQYFSLKKMAKIRKYKQVQANILLIYYFEILALLRPFISETCIYILSPGENLVNNSKWYPNAVVLTALFVCPRQLKKLHIP